MSKNRLLAFFLVLCGGAMLTVAPAIAQSEMDLLLFEKKAEGAQDEQKQKNKSSVDISESLTENLSKSKKKKESSKDSENQETESWLKSLISKGTSEIFKEQTVKEKEAEEKRIERVFQNRRSNAANFDISKVKLRMSPKEVEDTLTAQGYRKIQEKMEIPNFIKWRSEELCRQHGVIGFERLNACATMIAKENGFQFVEYQIYNRYTTRESIEVYFTSTFTDNLAHRIFYKSTIPFSDSKASKNIYLNNIKVFDFWRRIDLKYGKPDNETEVKWGLGGKKPYLKATTGRLELADPLLKDLDAARMFNEDTRFANTQYYTF